MKYTTFSVATFMVLFATLTLLAAQHTRHMFIGIGTLNPPRDSQAATSRDASTGGRNGFFGLARIVITDVSGDFEVIPMASVPRRCVTGVCILRSGSAAVLSRQRLSVLTPSSLIFCRAYIQGHLIQTPTGQTPCLKSPRNRGS